MSDDLLISLFAIGMPMLLVGTILSLKHRAKQREMQHREQMRALELGLPPGGAAPSGAAFVCAAIGAGVPVAACFFATITTLVARDGDVASLVWPLAMLISMAALFAGFRLATRLFLGGAAPGHPAPSRHDLAAKGVSDPDLYDVVGRRG
jgi:hypothetical protein